MRGPVEKVWVRARGSVISLVAYMSRSPSNQSADGQNFKLTGKDKMSRTVNDPPTRKKTPGACERCREKRIKVCNSPIIYTGMAM